jgi:hypothetical protein
LHEEKQLFDLVWLKGAKKTQGHRWMKELLSKINGTSNIESLMQHTRMPNHALKKNYLVGMIPGSSWSVTTN